MNGYQKMKMVRGMNVTKIVSAVTAMSMAVTSLVVAASANSTTSDKIESALGQLREYGIVAESVENHSHFEANFAAKNLELNCNYDVSTVSSRKDRTIDFKVTTDEKFEQDEVKYYFYGVYCNGSPVEVTYQSSEGVQTNSVIAVRFTEAGTKRFVINVPSAYHGETVVIHRLGIPEDAQEKSVAALVPVDEGVPYGSVDNSKASESIVSNTMQVAGEMFSTDKVVYVGSDIYKDIKQESDGRYSYCGNIIANNTNEFHEDSNAEMKVDELISSIKTASDELKNLNAVGENALYYEVNGSVNPGSSDANAINEKIRFIKNNPDYSLLVNVHLESGAENYVTLNSDHGVGDWESDTASRIVFNFIGGDAETTSVVLGDGFRGTALAPDAKVRVGSTMCGAIYSPSVNIQNGEVHVASYNFLNYAYSVYYESPEETTPEETTPEETTLVETTPEETTPETTPEETTPETTPEETTPETTPEETTPETTPEETTPETTPEETTPPETTPEETTPPETTPEETTPPETTPEVTTPEETTTEPVVTTTEPVVTTTEPVVTTTEPVVTTTEPVVTTTEPVVTTTEPVVTTTEPVATTTEPVVTVTEPAVTTTEPIVTTTEPVVTVTEPAVTTTEPVVTTTEPVVTTTEPVVTTTEPVVTTTEPPVTTTEPTVTTTIVTIEIDEEVPLDDLILIDEEVPLSDLPMNTGVDSHIGMFAAIGGGALLIGGGAQAYSVFLKKKK